jgi:hypothetical protein
MPAATARRGDLPFGQLVSDLLDRQVAQLDQDRPQRLCISIRFGAAMPRALRSVAIELLDVQPASMQRATCGRKAWACSAAFARLTSA